MSEQYIHEVSTENAQLDIQSNFPDFVIKKIEPAGQGFANIAFLINDEYIFRFAKRKHASEQLQRETTLLLLVEPYVKIQIPHVEYAGRRKINNFAFMGYKKIVGETLEKDTFKQLDNNTQEKFTEQIAHFIADTHKFPTNKALSAGVEVIDYKTKYQKEFEATERLIYPLIDNATQAYLKNLFTDYLNDDKNFTYTPTFNHGEVSPYHIIINKGRTEVTGIIDFGDMHIGDPDFDFSYLHSHFGKECITNLLKHYHHEDHSRLMKKLNFFSSYDKLQMIFVGIREDKEILKNALLKLKDHTTKI